MPVKAEKACFINIGFINIFPRGIRKGSYNMISNWKRADGILIKIIFFHIVI